MIAFLAIGLAIAINFRPLYYLDITRLNLVQKSGFNAVVIKDEVSAVTLRYNKGQLNVVVTCLGVRELVAVELVYLFEQLSNLVSVDKRLFTVVYYVYTSGEGQLVKLDVYGSTAVGDDRPCI